MHAAPLRVRPRAAATPRTISLALALALALAGASCGAPPASAVTGRVEQESFESALADETLTLLVRLPPGYDADTSRRYPVLYQLDATFLDEFDLCAAEVSRIERDGVIPETIVVGIGHTNARPDRNRFTDFLPPDPSVPGSPGRAPQFYRFVREELVPRVETRYRVDPSAGRSLSGHSLGGLFALYAFTQREPDGRHLFSNVLAADPSYGSNDGSIFAHQAALAAATRARPGRLYLSASRFTGATQHLFHDEMSARMSRDFPSLSLRTAYEETTHGGLITLSFERGLPFVLAAGGSL